MSKLIYCLLFNNVVKNLVKELIKSKVVRGLTHLAKSPIVIEYYGLILKTSHRKYIMAQLVYKLIELGLGSLFKPESTARN